VRNVLIISQSIGVGGGKRCEGCNPSRRVMNMWAYQRNELRWAS